MLLVLYFVFVTNFACKFANAHNLQAESDHHLLLLGPDGILFSRNVPAMLLPMKTKKMDDDNDRLRTILKDSGSTVPLASMWPSVLSKNKKETQPEKIPSPKRIKKVLGVFIKSQPSLYVKSNSNTGGPEFLNTFVRGNFGLSRYSFDRPRPLRWG